MKSLAPPLVVSAAFLAFFAALNIAGCPGTTSDLPTLADLLLGESATAANTNSSAVKPNTDPLPAAGNDQTAKPGELVILNGARSSDADANRLSFIWTQTDGPTVDLQAPFSSIASFNAPQNITAPTALTFRLTVIDGTVARTDDVSVTIAP